jgi:hypothetical protein
VVLKPEANQEKDLPKTGPEKGHHERTLHFTCLLVSLLSSTMIKLRPPVLFFFFIVVRMGYIVAFTKVLTM